jgi:multiple sugar transport system permease protein
MAARSSNSRGVVRWLRGEGPAGLIFALPMLLVFGVFAWWPILRSLPLSLQRTNLIDPAEWVGLANFEAVLADPLLWTATRNTVWFVVLGLVFGFPLPLALAVVMSELKRGRALFSVLAYLPAILPPVAGILLWRLFYDPRADGLFNTVAGWVGLGPYPWLDSAGLAMPSIVVQATWATFGTATVIYLAALTSVRAELYDAAEMDGATVWRRVWHITLPQLRGIILIMLLLQVIGTFQLFTEPYIMTGGGPEHATVTLLMLIYEYAIVAGEYGQGTALSLLLAAALAALSAVYLWATRRWSTS